MSLTEWLVYFPTSRDTGRPEAAINFLKQVGPVDLSAIWIGGINGAALGDEHLFDLSSHGGG